MKSFGILPKHIGYCFISKSFALNCYILATLTNKMLLLPLWSRLNINLFPDSLKLIGYSASAVIAASSKPGVDTSPITKIF